MKQDKMVDRKRLGYGCLVFSALILLCGYQEYQYYLQQDMQNMFFYGILLTLSALMLVRAAVMTRSGIGRGNRGEGKEKGKRLWSNM